MTPEGALSESDFAAAASVIDPYLESQGNLNGLIICTEKFPGWDSFSGMISHIKFVKDHQKRLSRVALVTDSELGSLAEQMAGHFMSAQIRHFPFGQIEEAKHWILESIAE